MSIQDLKYLKKNSRENSMKFHFPLSSLSQILGDTNNFIINNVFTIHILEVFINDPLFSNYGDCILNVYANDIKMDSIAINQQRNLNFTGLEYEKKIINPLAKVSELKFKWTTFDNDEITNIEVNGNI